MAGRSKAPPPIPKPPSISNVDDTKRADSPEFESVVRLHEDPIHAELPPGPDSALGLKNEVFLSIADIFDKTEYLVKKIRTLGSSGTADHEASLGIKEIHTKLQSSLAELETWMKYELGVDVSTREQLRQWVANQHITLISRLEPVIYDIHILLASITQEMDMSTGALISLEPQAILKQCTQYQLLLDRLRSVKPSRERDPAVDQIDRLLAYDRGLSEAQSSSILCFDGGGVKSFASLLILKELMGHINFQAALEQIHDSFDTPLKPCDVFDFFYGSSSGGLIAIMLGRLEMTIDECIVKFRAYAQTIFSHPRSSSRSFSTVFPPKYNQKRLVHAVKEIIGDFDPTAGNDKWRRNTFGIPNSRCKTGVLATDMSLSEPYMFRTFDCENEASNYKPMLLGMPLNPEPASPLGIEEIARATSAAPLLFSPVNIEGRQYVDGGLTVNNPSEQAMRDVAFMQRDNLRNACLVSIGSGVVPGHKKSEWSWNIFGEWRRVLRTLRDSATQTEATHKNMSEMCSNNDVPYFRFNIELKTGISADDWAMHETIASLTAQYLMAGDVQKELHRCASAVVSCKLRQRPLHRTCTGCTSRGQKDMGERASVVFGRNHLMRTPESAPKPYSAVPFRRDPDFVDRGDLLSGVDQRCSQSAGRTALVGLGGVGKSQLAIEYAHRITDRSPDTWVFWMYASNTARFEQGYRDIAEVVKIAGRKDPKADILKLVNDWLCASETQWLMILDNVDDAGFLNHDQPVGLSKLSDSSGQVARPLREYIPQSPNGSILITTRNREAARTLVDENDIISVNPMDETSGVELLVKKLGPSVSNDHKDARELVAALDFMPLAIVQAGAYISKLAPRYSVRQYIEEFQRSDRKKSSLLNYEGGQLRRDGEAKSSTIITWQLSFEHIRQTRPSAADLLSLMSFFDSHGIPEALIRGQANEVECEGRGSGENMREDNDVETDSGLSQDDEFEKDVQLLRDFSFISIAADPKVFQMHKLVQLATKQWLEASKQLERWRQQYIRNLFIKLPIGEYENWDQCRVFYPHVKAALDKQPDSPASQIEWSTVLYRAAWYAWRIGNAGDAERLALPSLRLRKSVLGDEHNDTIDSMMILGHAYKDSGRWKEAEELAVQVMESRKRVLGQDHPSTLTSMSNLASIYTSQGRWNEAEELEVQAMESRKRVLAQDHPDTLTSMSNLASISRFQGRWNEAEELEVQAMESRKRVLGQDHPSTLTSMSNLASIYTSQGRWNEAEELEVQAMESRKKVLGQDHPDTLTSMSNLALTYISHGRWDAAEELCVQVMETRKKTLGEDHPSTLTSMSNLASTYRNQGRWDAAEELEVQVMETSKKKLGEDHPDTLSSIGNLASTYSNQGRWDVAEELEVQVMETRKKKLGKDHPDTLSSMDNLASTYSNQGRWDAAEELEVQVMETRKKKLGEEHPSTLTSVSNLAGVLESQGKYEEAEQMNCRALEGYEKQLGKEHPSTLTSVSNLALVLGNQGKYEEAEQMNRRALDGREKQLGKEHPSTLTSVSNLALVLESQGKYEEAEQMNRRALDGREKQLGKEHPSTLTSVSNLAGVLGRQGKYEEAEQMNRRALDGREKQLGKEHPDTLTSVYCLAYLFQQNMQLTEADELYQRAYNGYMKVLGPSHPTTVACGHHYSSLKKQKDGQRE